jgi:uncharacterized SAM-binding protein YcdF (DUF218 family)
VAVGLSVKHVVTLVFSLTGLIVGATVAALWVRLRHGRGRSWWLLWIVFAAYAVASTYAASHVASRPLVSGYSAIVAPESRAGRTAIVLLGGGEWTATGWDDGQLTQLTAPAAYRVLEARRVFGLFDDAWIVSSGGRVSANPSHPTSAAAMRVALLALGVPAERIVLEEQSLTTRDEAVEVAPILERMQPARVILVTSDLHMLRSMGAFRAAGVQPVPSVARDPYPSLTWQQKWLPTVSGLTASGRVAHEAIGLAYYWALGWWRASGFP